MYGFRRATRRSRGGFRRFARRVRRVTGITMVKRIILDQLVIPDVTTVAYDNPLTVTLLECTEAQDEEVESNGTTIADAPLYSRITAIKTKMTVGDATALTCVRFMVYKCTDGDDPITALGVGLADGAFHTSNQTPNNRELVRNTLAKGYIMIPPDKQVAPLNIRISREAMRRAGSMREGDLIRAIFAKDATGTTLRLWGMGNIYLRANG